VIFKNRERTSYSAMKKQQQKSTSEKQHIEQTQKEEMLEYKGK